MNPAATAQAKEIKELCERLGIDGTELARRAGLNPKTIRNVLSGTQRLGGYKMDLVRNVGSIPVYAGGGESKSLKEQPFSQFGEQSKRLRLVPVVSWAQAGSAVSYEDLPSHWMARMPTDSDDPQAIGVEVSGDSMEPEFKAGQIVLLSPSLRPQNGDVVVAKLKKQGILMKLFHTNGKKITLTSYNPAYPPLEHEEKDFHWIYVADTVLRKLRRKH